MNLFRSNLANYLEFIIKFSIHCSFKIAEPSCIINSELFDMLVISKYSYDYDDFKNYDEVFVISYIVRIILLDIFCSQNINYI